MCVWINHHDDLLSDKLVCEVVMGPDQKFLTWASSIFSCLGCVSHLLFGFGKFTLEIPDFSFFSLWVRSKSTQVKDGLASYLLWVKGMLGLG